MTGEVKAVFLDRDGVINDGSLYYTYKTKDFKLNKGVVEGLRILQRAGYMLIVVTNQGGIAKGEYTPSDVDHVHEYMRSLLAVEGINIQAVYFCPHHSDIKDCDCRKPKPGMLLSAIEEYQIDPSLSFIIGDSPRDIEAGFAAGVAGVKIEKNENIVPYCKKIAGI